jgi:hypothetical protein
VTRPKTQDEERGALLKAAVLALEGKPIEWSVDDCSSWPAQWAVDITGREFDWPVYDSREAAIALIEAAGSLEAIWSPILRKAGFAEVHGEEPGVGDIGIVKTRTVGDVGGIFAFGGVFCWRSERGMWFLGPKRHTIVKVWRV